MKHLFVLANISLNHEMGKLNRLRDELKKCLEGVPSEGGG
jgi:hypothetical protein